MSSSGVQMQQAKDIHRCVFTETPLFQMLPWSIAGLSDNGWRQWITGSSDHLKNIPSEIKLKARFSLLIPPSLDSKKL
jgi:hypothetical protein